MGLGAILAALALVLGRTVAPAPQEPDALVLEAADLVDPELGSLARLEGVATALIALIESEPARAREIEWEAVLVDLGAGFSARGKPASFVTGLRYQTALAWRTAGDVARARALLEAARPTLAEADPYAPWVWIELADLARFAARWSEARGYLEAARAALAPLGRDPFQHHPEERGAALALATWFDVAGQLYHELGRGELAAEHYAEGLARAQALGDDALWWAFVDDQMRLALALGRAAEVESLFERVRADERWTRGPAGDRGKLTLQHARARLERELQGERPRGETRALLAGLLEESAAYPHDALELEILLATEALDAGEGERAEAWIAAARARRAATGTGAEEASQQAFALEAVALRARRLAGGSASARATLASARATFEAFIAAWCATPELAGGVGFLQPAWRSQFLSQWLAFELNVLGEEAGAWAALEDHLRIQSCGSLTRALGASALDLARAQARLVSSERGALLYVPGREASLAFVLDARGAAAVALPPASELVRARRSLEEAALVGVADGRLAEAVARATRAFLPRELWQRLEPLHEILLVGGEGAGIFGFELLEPEAGRPLGLEFAISHVPSLPAAAALADRARPAPESGPWILVAPAEAGPAPPFDALEPVPFDSEHFERVAGIHGREESRLLRGDAASGSALRSQAFSEAHLASLITHGLFDPARERPAGLLLARGEALWCEDVETLRVPALVTLIACGAGRGGERRGDDGRTHLGASFLAAGAQAVVLGQADIEAELGHRLDEDFHGRVARGVPPAEALREARAVARDPESRTQALLVRLVGIGWEPLVVPRASPRGRGPAVVGGTLLAAGALAVLTWRRMRRASDQAPRSRA